MVLKRQETLSLLDIFGLLPKEVVSAGAVDTVMINTPREQLTQLTRNPDTIGAYDKYKQTVWLAKGWTTAWSHEALGHGLNAALSIKHCKRPETYDLNFAAANPPGFAYQKGYRKGQNQVIDNSTVEEYGAVDSDEDAATVAAVLVPVSPEARSKCAYREISDVVDTKIAISAARLEREVPGAGRLFATRIATRCL